MESFPPTAFVRQRKMKRIARVFFVVAVLAVATPVVAGLLGYNTDLPIGLIVACLMVVGVIIQARSDPAFARRSHDGK